MLASTASSRGLDVDSLQAATVAPPGTVATCGQSPAAPGSESVVGAPNVPMLVRSATRTRCGPPAAGCSSHATAAEPSSATETDAAGRVISVDAPAVSAVGARTTPRPAARA